MDNPLLRKLEIFGPLDEADRALVDSVLTKPRSIPQDGDIIREGDQPSDVHLVIEGFCCRYKLSEDGRRQIVAYLLPGDFCDLNVFILRKMDHTISALTPSRVVDIPRARILELVDRPAIARALWWATLVDEATLREWLLNIGQRDAETRTAHLFCEIHLRMATIGLVEDGEFSLPLSQTELGDTMGISNVHMNRVLQSLRAEGLILFKRGLLTIPNIEALRERSGFNPNYLHLDFGK